MIPVAPAVFLRSEVRARVAKVIRDSLPLGSHVAVSRSFPGSDLRAKHIYLSTTTGEVGNEVFSGSFLNYDDQFSFTVVCADGTAGMDSDSAEDAVQALANVVFLAVADPTFDDFEMLDGSGFLIESVMGKVDGPHAELRGDEGFVGFMTIDLMFHTRSQGR